MGKLSEVNCPFIQAPAIPHPRPFRPPSASSSTSVNASDSISQVNAQPYSNSSAARPSTSAYRPGKNCLETHNNFYQPGSHHLAPTPRRATADPRPATSYDVLGTLHHSTDSQSLQQVAQPNLNLPSVSHLEGYNQGNGVNLATISSLAPAVRNSPSGSRHSTQALALTTRQKNASIDLYEPRPSTAPAIESQKLSDMLPPKRELPFAKSVLERSTISSKKAKRSNQKREAQRPTTAEAVVEQAPEMSQSKTSQPAPRSSQARPKKQASSRSRKAPDSQNAISPILGVTDLLKRSPQSAKEVASVSRAIDTQALLDSVDQRRKSPRIEGDPKEVEMVQNGSTAEGDNSGIGAVAAGGMATLFEETQETPPANVPVIQVRDSQEKGGPNPRNQASHGSTASTPVAESTSTTGRLPLAERPSSVATLTLAPPRDFHASTTSSPLATLLADPNFAGQSRLGAWAQSPEAERRAALETFICQNLQDENFLTLCKDLSGTWQRVLMGKY